MYARIEKFYARFSFFLDGTNNYIKGRDERDANNLKTQDIVSKGLPVVTVLIGVSTKYTNRVTMWKNMVNLTY